MPVPLACSTLRRGSFAGQVNAFDMDMLFQVAADAVVPAEETCAMLSGDTCAQAVRDERAMLWIQDYGQESAERAFDVSLDRSRAGSSSPIGRFRTSMILIAGMVRFPLLSAVARRFRR
ncbi:hypothetical protein [Streptomyces guryensis]|uniref:Uncharacterized protein n=1 Tax=Streptomyces guryensis TaxID=2886947 RepID=A0A9Q3VMG0_9ACTN|nr:hypothetical protein [Streptomyces guryensis]MCD9874732.1 hypothetical protein [Streptomyces guryensis]